MREKKKLKIMQEIMRGNGVSGYDNGTEDKKYILKVISDCDT